MSYAAISTRNTIGTKPLPPPTLSGWGRSLTGQIFLMRGMSGLGDLDMNDQAVVDALSAGIDQGTLSTLVAEGASDGQLEALANGQLDVPTLMAQLTGNLPAAGSASGTASTFPTPAGLTAAQQAQVQDAINQTGLDPTDEASWYDVTGQLAAINLELKALQAQVIQYPAVQAVISADVTQMQSQYTDLASQWTYAYTAVFGEAPAGLNGLGTLGIAPLAVVAVIGVFIVVVAGIYELNKSLNNTTLKNQAAVNSSTAQITQSTANATVGANQASLIAQIKAAVASGNTALATQLTSALMAMQQVPLSTVTGTPPAPPQTLTAWFEDNWQWVALAGGIFFLGPSLIKKI